MTVMLGFALIANGEVTCKGTDDTGICEGSGTFGGVCRGAEASQGLSHFSLSNGVMRLWGLEVRDAAGDETIHLRGGRQSAVDLQFYIIEAVADIKLNRRLEVCRAMRIDRCRRDVWPRKGQQGIKHIVGQAIEDLSTRNDVIGSGLS